MQRICLECNKTYPINSLEYKCECGGLFDYCGSTIKNKIELISLGESKTPIIEKCIEGINLKLKLDYYMPSGSFKDRGAKTLVSTLKDFQVTEIVEDSSGNAGASIAAYSAAANIKCHIYLPENTPQGKTQQISSYGAEIVKIPGNRENTSRAIKEACKSQYYASHVYNPLFFEGTKTISKEIFEQVGLPEAIVLPAGNGTLLLGIYKGFKELTQDHLPKIIAVQSENCCPLYNEYNKIEVNRYKPTSAKGIAVENPARKKEMISAINESNGEIIIVSEEDIAKAKKELGYSGIFVENTAAVGVAGAVKFATRPENQEFNLVVPLTGTGLKET
ncbi:pyridoxal-phosphate dependent enzyme [Natranaerobius trueperi]|uniref:Threonine synthase n=1 Tax=Natranaerobius trueperi TaxID=759412 RepID=A0A226BX62_9FIRM|nr:pyridoxal-phosphate dependent enzyme [Natranaerobius trueperi]OWZ83545.1 threonine synthase [Natranaerobius trueperi]